MSDLPCYLCVKSQVLFTQNEILNAPVPYVYNTNFDYVLHVASTLTLFIYHKVNSSNQTKKIQNSTFTTHRNNSATALPLIPNSFSLFYVKRRQQHRRRQIDYSNFLAIVDTHTIQNMKHSARQLLHPYILIHVLTLHWHITNPGA